MIKNIVFDMGGVLIHYNPREIVAHLNLPAEEERLLLREVFGSVEWVRLDRGSIREEDGAAAMKSRLPDRLHSAADRLLSWWELELRPMEGMAPLLEELKEKGYRLYLLSNASMRQPEYFGRIPGSGLFDGKLVSSFYQLLKPQPEIFALLLRKFSLEAGECFFVDDNNANVESAEYCGFHGAVFDGDLPRLRRELNAAGVPVKLE